MLVVLIWRWHAWGRRLSDKPRAAAIPLVTLGMWIMGTVAIISALYAVQFIALSLMLSLV